MFKFTGGFTRIKLAKTKTYEKNTRIAVSEIALICSKVTRFGCIMIIKVLIKIFTLIG